jgi:hypothetical protein
VRLLLSLANAPAARRQLVKGLSLKFTDNRVLFAFEFLMAKVLTLLPRLRTLNAEVSVHENRHRALAWIFPVTPPSACAHLRRPSGKFRALPLYFFPKKKVCGR